MKQGLLLHAQSTQSKAKHTKKGNRTVPKYIPPVAQIVVILGDPGAVSGGGKKSQRARKKFGLRKVKNSFSRS